MNSVYITAQIPKNGIELLRRKGFDVDVNQTGKSLSQDDLKESFSRYSAVVTLITDKVDEEIIDSASPKLKIIANYGVGYDNIDVLYARRHGIVVTNTPGVAGESVAEHTFALILACVKRLVESDKYVRLGKYEKWDPLDFVSSQIWGKTIGIVGLGRIGTFVGQIAFGGFRMEILYNDIIKASDFELLTGAKKVSLGKLLGESDFVSLHVPLTPQTKHLIGKDEFMMMRRTAILINTSRGQVVDEEALIDALRQKKIAGAGLDVYEHEPHIPHALTVMSNVVLTPHIASATVETREAMSKIVAENIIAVFEGKNPFGVIKVS